VGFIKYYEKDNGEKPIAVGIILGVALPIIAIIVLLAICVVRRHRKHKPSENYIPDVWKDEGPKEGEETELNHVSVKADMNGSIPDDKGKTLTKLLLASKCSSGLKPTVNSIKFGFCFIFVSMQYYTEVILLFCIADETVPIRYIKDVGLKN